MLRRGRLFRPLTAAATIAATALVWAPPASPPPSSQLPVRPVPPGSITVASDGAHARTSVCGRPIAHARQTADELLANQYALARFPRVSLPEDPRWNEDPVHDPNWPYNLHTLRFANALWAAWVETGVRAYRDRYEFILHDWYRDNPRAHPPSRWSWADHSTAWRGIVYACALERLPGRAWVREAALLHGRMLADESFFVDHGNHALNQAVGLLELGCALDVGSWRTLAARRIDRLAAESIDVQGVTNEQAIGYQWYNFRRYSQAAAALEACGMTLPSSLGRVERMTGFLAFAALPNGRWELIGDTLNDPLAVLRGTPAEFAATAGASGVRPLSFAALYDAGFAFIRSGWGDRRDFVDETALSLRFGPARRFHGHVDAAALTMYAHGDRILIDPGLYRYRNDALRLWLKSAAAHNTIAVDGRPMRPEGATRLLAWDDTPTWTYVAVAHEKIPGVSHVRRVFYSRALDVTIVDDRVTAESRSTVRQWWHLHPDARPRLVRDGFFTGRSGSRANAWVVQLADRGTSDVARGGMRPIQGWMSLEYGKVVPASAVSVRTAGSRVRFVTLIVPSRGAARSWTIRFFSERRDGFVLEIERDGTTQRIEVRGDDASATTL